MEANNKIFCDSNYFIALFNPDDGSNGQAIASAKVIKAQNITLVVSSYIFLEVVTVLAQKYEREAAIRAGRYFLEDPFVQFIHMHSNLQGQAWQIFQEIKQKDVSFVDCSVIACMKAEGINKLLTFDIKDFKILQKHHRFGFFT